MNALLVSLAVAGGVVECTTPRQLRIEVRVLRGDPLGSTADGAVKSLAEPTLSCFNGQTATFLVGGHGGAKGPFGIQLEFCPAVLKNGAVRLGVTTAFSTPRETAVAFGDEQRTVTAFDTQTRRHERLVKAGEPFRVRIAADSPEVQTWAEVTVREERRPK